MFFTDDAGFAVFNPVIKNLFIVRVIRRLPSILVCNKMKNSYKFKKF